ncbi:MAG: NAD(P)H-dependent oxidoreductase [Arachidicoccus sp.]|nr:NAD(P)H-dependent oxidoreductase [Arachidicoccus sp.]
MNIEIVSGSQRENSVSIRVAIFLQRYLAEKYPQHNIGLIDLRQHILPHIDKVHSAPDQAPEELQPLAHRVFDAHAFILVTPEYNGTFSPALANFFDLFPKQVRKVFGLSTVSPGAMGGIRAALALQHFSIALFGIPLSQMLVVGNVENRFDPHGNLLEEKFQNSIDNFVTEFMWLTEKIHG